MLVVLGVHKNVRSRAGARDSYRLVSSVGYFGLIRGVGSLFFRDLGQALTRSRRVFILLGFLCGAVRVKGVFHGLPIGRDGRG